MTRQDVYASPSTSSAIDAVENQPGSATDLEGFADRQRLAPQRVNNEGRIAEPTVD